MKRSLFFHPLVKGLCLILCLCALMGTVFTGYRCFWMGIHGMFEPDREFRELYVSGNSDLYWPSCFFTGMEFGKEQDPHRWWGDRMANVFDRQFCAMPTDPEELRNAVVRKGNLVCPRQADPELLGFLSDYQDSSFVFRFEKDGVVLFSNMEDLTDIGKDEFLIAKHVFAASDARAEASKEDTGKSMIITYGLRPVVGAGAVHPDGYSNYYLKYLSDRSVCTGWLAAAGGFGICSVIFLICVLIQSGIRRRDEPGTVHLLWIDRIPLELSAVILLGGGVLSAAVSILMADIITPGKFFRYETLQKMDGLLILTQILLMAFGILLTVLGLSMAVRRMRAGAWWKNTILYRIFCLIRKVSGWLCKHIRQAVCAARNVGAEILSHIPQIWMWVLFIAGYHLLLLILTVIVYGWVPFRAVVVILFGMTIPLYAGIKKILQYEKVCRGAEEIVSGRLDYQIDDARLYGRPKQLANVLNHIGGAMQKAVEERMKSERFRSELITNVSHDLKTPLTSIINYIDLLSREPMETEQAKVYVDTLARQAERLKKLTEDLLEASRASSGTVAMTLSDTDAGELLTQAAGEYEERFRSCGLCPVVSIQNLPLHIIADGRHLWRVFDNLLSNICKYSMKGTRVYLSAAQNQGRVEVIFRNIADQPVAVEAEELSERFVRGDSSRHTEGSGLGLAIAKSLTELQGGTLTLSVDGDLFKAVVSFPVKK